MINLVFPGNPMAKARHRSARFGSGIRSYDVQSAVKKRDGQIAIKQMLENGSNRPLTGILHMTLYAGYPYPKNMPQKRKLGHHKETRPDLDNVVKYYSDILNGVAYEDDSRIVALEAEKRYSDVPFVGIELREVCEMVNEHAITLTGEITIDDLSYMVKKANKLGRSDRKITRVYWQDDDEGRHVYFETDALQKRGD